MKEALDDFNQALLINPSSPAALYGRGFLRKLAGDPRGVDDMDTATALRPKIAGQLAERGLKE